MRYFCTGRVGIGFVEDGKTIAEEYSREALGKMNEIRKKSKAKNKQINVSSLSRRVGN